MFGKSSPGIQQRGSGASGLAHHKTSTAGACRRLAFMRYRRATALRVAQIDPAVTKLAALAISARGLIGSTKFYKTVLPLSRHPMKLDSPSPL